MGSNETQRQLGTHETQKDYCGLRILMRIIETDGDSRVLGRLRENHETQRNYWGLARLMRLKETSGDL